MRRLLPILILVVALVAVGVAGILFTVKRVVEVRSGPIHRFPVPAGETFLADDRAAAVAREVMTRDGFPESAWKLLDDGRTNTSACRTDPPPPGNTHPNRRSVSFFYADSRTPTRYVEVELRNGEIVARGSLGK